MIFPPRLSATLLTPILYYGGLYFYDPKLSHSPPEWGEKRGRFLRNCHVEMGINRRRRRFPQNWE